MQGCEPFTVDQEAKLVEYFSKKRFPNRNIALLKMGIQTGFRGGELVSIKLRQVVKGGRIADRVCVPRANMKGGRTGKKISSRSIILTDETKHYLQIWIDELAERYGITDPEAYLFQNQRSANQPLQRNGLCRLLTDAAKALGFTTRVGSHSLRKTFADRVYTALMESGNGDPMRTLAKGLGHENINNTDKYLSFREDELNRAIRGVFGGNGDG